MKRTALIRRTRMLVWWKDEFDEKSYADEGWKVPDQTYLFTGGSRVVDDVQEAAELYAEYFFYNLDGHENTWPLNFVVWDGAAFHTVAIRCEYEPQFRVGDTKPIAAQLCAHCGVKRAVCVGLYEGEHRAADGTFAKATEAASCEPKCSDTIDQPACDDCCAHGNEDGHCHPIEVPA